MHVAQSIATLATYLKGKRLEKFTVSVAIIRTAEARGSYQARESVKALAGLSGLVSWKKAEECLRGEFSAEHGWFRAKHCISSGAAYETWVEQPFSVEGIPQDVVEAWVCVCCWARKTHKTLIDARPLPVITAIGLSPKVTKTLTEMALDLILPTIVPAKIEAYEEQARHAKTGALLFKQDGSPTMRTAYRVKWSDGIKLGKSRFCSGCQACGKWIPSGRYVPIEADCRRNDRVGLWVGRDCAHNIFGIKDQGIAMDK